MTIDRWADKIASRRTPGERLHDDWLADLPEGQWPAYIDECAELMLDGILIGETDLTSGDFEFETGPYYKEGLAVSAGIDPERTSLPLGKHKAKEIGKVAWVFSQLKEDIRKSSRTNFTNPSRAIEAAINKALVEQIETGGAEAGDLETIRLPDDATISTLVSEVFCRPRSEVYIELLLDTISQAERASLLELLDEPRMVTQLWDHQAEALDAWLTNGCRGYVDMATATGKTVLGLAAIAHHFGALHPNDRALSEEALRPNRDGRATVIVIAHRDLILDQWKREFDTHLNIPEQSTTRSGEHTIEFEWGDVHFWTPNRLKQEGVPRTDLVVLDETHHYLGSSGFGSILDEIDGHLLALSGSLDETNAKTLTRRGIPELYKFTLQDGQQAGIIPQCDWDVHLTPYEEQSKLAEVTARYREGYERYSSGISPPSEADRDETMSFENLSEARSVAQSSAGRTLKEKDPAFREFSSAVMARQLTQYNLSPTLSTVVRLTLDRIDQHKCVVLLETADEIERVVTELEAQLGDGFDSLVTVLESDDDISVVERFDREQEFGAIIGLARTLGEGIDIQTADVCINRGRGRLSRSLVQRMGRILRNPDGQKHAQFFHVSGVPTQSDAILEREDGITLLETASQLLAWGEGFNARPVFHIDEETVLTESILGDLERAGAEAIEEWTPDRYEWPKHEPTRSQLESLCTSVTGGGRSALLAIERPEKSKPGEVEPVEPRDQPTTDAIRFVAAESVEARIPTWLYELAEYSAPGDTAEYIESTVRTFTQEQLEFSPVELSDPEDATLVRLNPALEAVLLAYADDVPLSAVVTTAIASGLTGREDTEKALTKIDADSETVATELRRLAGVKERG